LFDSLDQGLTNRYLRKEEAFSMVKPSESTRTLETLANELFSLIERFSSDDDVTSMSSYQPMVRVLREQCLVEENPDAGYDGHKGKGYQVQVAETFCADQDQEALSLITYVEVEPAHESDANALIPSWSPPRSVIWSQNNFWPIPCTAVITTVKEPSNWGSKWCLRA
jgi:hypothetical protein